MIRMYELAFNKYEDFCFDIEDNLIVKSGAIVTILVEGKEMGKVPINSLKFEAVEKCRLTIKAIKTPDYTLQNLVKLQLQNLKNDVKNKYNWNDYNIIVAHKQSENFTKVKLIACQNHKTN